MSARSGDPGGAPAPGAKPAHVRLFVALELPPAARTALVRWRAQALRGLPPLRPIAPEALHATLCFLGWRPQSEIEPIASGCATALAGHGAPELRFGEAVWLPLRRPNVLAVELLDASGGLARIQAAVSAALADGGFYTPEKRPFFGHVTVARVRRGMRPGPAPLPSPPSLTFAGAAVTLYRSRLSPAGARYEALARLSAWRSASMTL